MSVRQCRQRVICPATNFVAVYDKIGHKAIQNVLNKLGVVYDANTIIQASDLKEELEKMTIKKNEKTIISFDAVKMYPSITLSMSSKIEQHKVALPFLPLRFFSYLFLLVLANAWF